MAIITPLKKIFNWQTASEKIPYKVYTAYITVDDSDNMYAYEVLENTIGAIKFETSSPGVYKIVLPYSVPRHKIMIPNGSDGWGSGYTTFPIYGGGGPYMIQISPGYGINTTYNEPTNYIDFSTILIAGYTATDWRTAFGCAPTGECVSYPIEIRVYN